MDMTITFPGGKQVSADYNGFIHRTDQPVADGGDGTAPSPFDLFLASLGTCAGYYVLSFCQQRGIDTAGLELGMSLSRRPDSHLIGQVDIVIILPAAFPAKYREAVVQAAQACTVKKHLQQPPAFNVTVGGR